MATVDLLCALFYMRQTSISNFIGIKYISHDYQLKNDLHHTSNNHDIIQAGS